MWLHSRKRPEKQSHPHAWQEGQWAYKGCSNSTLSSSAFLFLRHDPEHGLLKSRVLQTLPGHPIRELLALIFPSGSSP